MVVLGFSQVCLAEDELTSDQIKQYKKGIFEIVTLKLEDTTEYKDDFPFDLIPFHIRNDKYYSVGTAFLIGEDTFVSAAHVFQVGYRSQFSNNFSIRDHQGQVFKIVEIEKYSDYRDLVQFKIKQDTSDYYNFAIAQNYEAGDTVYAAGNALGEGVIFRKGSLTSFTYEPVNGLWKNIRFSAAASPGNSGGPLLNLAGEVIGIVTKKSTSENLNHALPIQELVEFTTESAEFFDNQLAEMESTKTHRYTWKFSTPLPKSISELRQEAENSLYSRFVSGRQEFEEKYQQDIFPNHPNVSKYLKNQSNENMLSVIDINGNGEWFLFEPSDTRVVKIHEDESLYFSSSDKMLGDYQFTLDKPQGTKLIDFINNKKGILDGFLNSVQWHRTVMNTQVHISSYGEPAYEEAIKDVYGRVWHMAIWNDTYSDRGIMIYCLPVPKGVACDLSENSTAAIEVEKLSYHENLHRIMLSYSAKMSEWQEFVSLPKEMLPAFLHKAKVSVEDSNIAFSIGNLSGALSDLKMDGDSELYLAVEIDPYQQDQLVVGHANFTPNANEDNAYYVSKYYDLKENASENYQDFWAKFTTLKSPYNFEIIDEGKLIKKMMNLSANGKGAKLTQGSGDDMGFLAGCQVQSDVSIDELNRTCDAFINGID
ncbi:serine protease [Alteromonas aestuariivivens]|uniref:Serine protease n=2 Tax=Alteromonas aestuariivivens TaxID=1938339 RepID=A0A3D8MB02_9ALTE|nr:serine protease [Alteromonas aestuariivivens]